MNQDPEQIARDNIDKQLIACGWVIHDKDKLNLNAGIGVVVRYYLTQDGKETDYVLFVDKKPVGVIEAKREEEGHKLKITGKKDVWLKVEWLDKEAYVKENQVLRVVL